MARGATIAALLGAAAPFRRRKSEAALADVGPAPKLSGAAWLALAAIVLLAGSLTLYWPGYALYDSVTQYAQALGGVYDDWHPPAMARLWAVLHPLAAGAGPLLMVQLGLYWLGLGLIAARLGGDGRARAGAAVLVIGVLPSFLGWQVAVLKDAQMTGALLAVAGLGAMRRAGLGRGAAIALLAAYATLVRANAVFASVPLLVLLAPRLDWRWRLAAGLGGVGAVLLVAPMVNHGLLGASRSGVETTLPLYDLAGIVEYGGHDALPVPIAAAVLGKGCYKPFFWDPLGDPSRCDGDVAPLREVPRGQLARRWAGAILRHPLPYVRHRLGHLNSTERWLVPLDWPSAAPPVQSEPNAVGLGSPGSLARGWQVAAGWLALTPLGWPAVFVALGLAALAAARTYPEPDTRRLATALLGSALALEASFAVVSIASDLRYHLWPMLAVALATVLLADRRPTRTVALAGGAALTLVIGGGLAARAVLPPAPATYRGMLA